MISKRDFLKAMRHGERLRDSPTYVEFNDRHRKPVGAGLFYFDANGAPTYEVFQHYYQSHARMGELEGVGFLMET